MSGISRSAQPGGTEAADEVFGLLKAFWLGRAVYAAAKLGIADLLRDGAKTGDEIAAATGTNAAALHRLMRALSSEGWFERDAEGRFVLTALSRTLLSDAPGSLRAFAIAELGEEHYAAWGEILHSLRTGDTAFERVYGMALWEFFAKNPENAANFHAAMQNVTAVEESAILASYDFGTARTVVDVGGGDGSLLCAVLKAHAGVRGIVFDLPHAVEAASTRISANGLNERCAAVAGDFTSAVPGGGDLYILKWVLHDWDEARSIQILRNCQRAMRDEARILIIEALLPDDDRAFLHRFMDLNMLIMNGGRERNEAEYQGLLGAAGFDRARVIATGTEISLLEAKKKA